MHKIPPLLAIVAALTAATAQPAAAHHTQPTFDQIEHLLAECESGSNSTLEIWDVNSKSYGRYQFKWPIPWNAAIGEAGEAPGWTTVPPNEAPTGVQRRAARAWWDSHRSDAGPTQWHNCHQRILANPGGWLSLSAAIYCGEGHC